MNHLDYIGIQEDFDDPQNELGSFIRQVESSIGREVDWFGFSGLSVIEREAQEA